MRISVVFYGLLLFISAVNCAVDAEPVRIRLIDDWCLSIFSFDD